MPGLALNAAATTCRTSYKTAGAGREGRHGWQHADLARCIPCLRNSPCALPATTLSLAKRTLATHAHGAISTIAAGRACAGHGRLRAGLGEEWPPIEWASQAGIRRLTSMNAWDAARRTKHRTRASLPLCIPRTLLSGHLSDCAYARGSKLATSKLHLNLLLQPLHDAAVTHDAGAWLAAGAPGFFLTCPSRRCRSHITPPL